MDHDELGRIVRAAWVEWAKEQPNPKPSWLVPWEELSEPDKDADRRIGAAVELAVMHRLDQGNEGAIDYLLESIRGVVQHLEPVPGGNVAIRPGGFKALTRLYEEHHEEDTI